MIELFRQLNTQLFIFALFIIGGFLFATDWASKEEKQTKQLLNQWAEKLDRQTTKAGTYIQWEKEELPVTDGWGTPLRVYYKNEGIAEVLYVTSAGQDAVWDSADDLHETRMQVNGKGIGEGIKANTAIIAKEAVKGTAAGIKEEASGAARSVKDKFLHLKDTTKEKIHNLRQGDAKVDEAE
ncbi:hypothetical protein [Desulfogranum japonicum]|uniref:hypothetical protein n=1 Tax=Desulfogranum japonicum TaxID=231447 RepID=UPI0003FC12ED|nr:hypothetical protein [Desulfogranum japonicum]